MVREIEKITETVIKAYRRVRRKRALWKVVWAVLSAILKSKSFKRREIPSVYAVNKYHLFIRIDGKLYEFIIVYDKVFVYKYREIDKFATKINWREK
jgi:hypothetical protein